MALMLLTKPKFVFEEFDINTKCMVSSVVIDLGRVITLQKKEKDVLAGQTLLSKIYQMLKKCNPVEFEEKENHVKLMDITMKHGSFPMEFSLMRGFHLMNTNCLPNVNNVVIFCNIAGANAIELGQFKTAMDFLSFAQEFIQESTEIESRSCICVIAVIENNIGCTQGLMGQSQTGCKSLIRALHLVQKLISKELKEECFSEMDLLDIVLNNLARTQIDSKKVDQGLSTLSKTCLQGMLGNVLTTKTGKKDFEDLGNAAEESASCSRLLHNLRICKENQKIDGSETKTEIPCDSIASKTRKTLLFALAMNCASALMRVENYMYAQKALQLFSVDKEFPRLYTLVSLRLMQIKSLQDFGKESGLPNAIEVDLIQKSLAEKSFRLSVFPLIRVLSRVLVQKGERIKSKGLLQKGISSCKEVLGVNHSQTTSLTETFDELFPIMRNIPSRRIHFLRGLRDVPIMNVVSMYIHPFNLPLIQSEDTSQDSDWLSMDGCLGRILSVNSLTFEEIFKSSLIGSSYILNQEVPHVFVTSFTSMSLERVKLEQRTLSPVFSYYHLASLCLLLDAVLGVEPQLTLEELTRNMHSLIRNCLEIFKIEKRLDGSDAETSDMEFYKDFYGVLSFFTSFKQDLVSGVSNSLLTIVTCGRQSKCPEDDVITQKPLFNKIDLEVQDCQDIGEKPKRQAICVVVLRSAVLLDIGELRGIHERNLKSVLSHLSPQVSILIEVVPEISKYLKSLPHAFELLKTTLKTLEKEKETTNKLQLCYHLYRKQGICGIETEPAVVSAVLHHRFRFENLLEEDHKSSKKIEMLFKKPEHGMLLLMSRDKHVDFYHKVLKPSGSGVIPNDITDIVDDVVEKCSEQFGMSIDVNLEWHEVVDVEIDDDIDELQRAVAEIEKMEKSIDDLKNKVQELTEFTEELQEQVAYLETRQKNFPNHDIVDGDSAIGSSVSSCGASCGSSSRRVNETSSQSLATSNEAEPHETNFHNEPYASVDNATRAGSSIPLYNRESEQTNALSFEYKNDEMLREIGNAEFHRELAERKYQKYRGVSLIMKNFKQKKRNRHQTEQGSSGMKQAIDVKTLHANNPNLFSNDNHEASSASSAKCLEIPLEKKLIATNTTDDWKGATNSEGISGIGTDKKHDYPSDSFQKVIDVEGASITTPLQSIDVLPVKRMHLSNGCREDQSESDYSSIDTNKFLSLSDYEDENACNSQMYKNKDETDSQSCSPKEKETINSQPSSSNIEDQHETRTQEEDSSSSIVADGPCRSSRISNSSTKNATNSSPDMNCFRDSDQLKCYQDKSPHYFGQPVTSTTRNYYSVQNQGVRHLSLLSSLQVGQSKGVHEVSEDVQNVTERERCFISDGPSFVKKQSDMLSSTMVEESKNNTNTEPLSTAKSSEKSEIEASSHVIVDGPISKKQSRIFGNEIVQEGNNDTHIEPQPTAKSSEKREIEASSHDIVDGPISMKQSRIFGNEIVQEGNNDTQLEPQPTAKSSEKREIEGTDHVIPDGPWSLNSLSKQSGTRAVKSNQNISFASASDTATAKLNHNSFPSLPAKLSQPNLTSQRSLSPKFLTRIHEEPLNLKCEIHENYIFANGGKNKQIYPEDTSLSEESESNPSFHDYSNEELGVDRLFLSRHSRDPSLIFRAGHASLPVINLKREASVHLASHGASAYEPAYMEQVVPDGRHSSKVLPNGEKARKHFSLQHHLGRNDSEKHLNQSVKRPFLDIDNMQSKPISSVFSTASSEPVKAVETINILADSSRSNVCTSNVHSKNQLLTEQIESGIDCKLATDQTASDIKDNLLTKSNGSGVDTKFPAEPMGSGVDDNPNERTISDGRDTVSGIAYKPSTEPVSVIAAVSTEALKSDNNDNSLTASSAFSCARTLTARSDDIRTELTTLDVSDKSNESIKSHLSTSTDDSPSSSGTIKDEPSDSNLLIKSLEETVTRYKTTLNSLMTEAMREARRRENELKRKREREEIEKQLELRRKKEREKSNGAPLPKLPIQESSGDKESSCQHFKRGCDVFFPCCNAYYPCHRCHNSSEQCSEKESKAGDATLIRCRSCMTEQEITPESQYCKNCKKKLSEYFCAICKHFTADDKKPYHCDPCGICRIHRDNSFHCDVCNVCLNQRLRGKHRCRPDSGHDECCICLEDAFSGCQVLPCSHKVHRECAVLMLRNNVKTCPICRAPIYEN